jgi:nucleotide-binding universal stress UspA family protein
MRSDMAIKRDVEDELRWSPDIDATDIALAVKDGVVALTGFAKSYSDVVAHLARHGIAAKHELDPTEDLDPADAILSRAADLATDMIVMGAYGHSRLREMIVGGTMRDILDRMTVPVLMSR